MATRGRDEDELNLSKITPPSYGWSPEVQRKVVALCLRDPTAWGQLGAKVFDATFITLPPLRAVATVLYRACAENGDAPPSPEYLADLVREAAERKKPAEADQIRREEQMVLTADLSDLRVIRTKAAEWAREQAVGHAAWYAAQLVDRGALGNGQGAKIVQMLQEALAVGEASQGFLRIIRDRNLVIEELERVQPKTPTGFDRVDLALEGGAEPGLYMMAGAPKIGKSAFLTQLAAAACRRGLTAWYVSGEITMRPMLRRLISSMTGFPKAAVKAEPRRSVDRLSKAYSQTGGEVLLEYAPGFTVTWLKSRLRQHEARGERVGVIITDFIDLMRGRKQEEHRFELEEIGRELRDFSIEAGVPIWTAKALNRAAVTKAVPTEADLAECFGLVYVVDALFVLCATKKEMQHTGPDKDGRVGPKPIIRIFYAVGREERDHYLLGAWDRNNDQQQWTYLKDYSRQAVKEAEQAEKKEDESA
jgi:DnaB-like helicase C terminal domain